MKSKCCFCKKEYETYIIFLCDNVEEFLLEKHIKLIYYDKEKNEGVCEKCREKEFHNPVWLIQNWLPIRLHLECKLIDFIKAKDKKMIEVVKKALLRIKKVEKRLEKTPEVQALYRKNNPAMFKKPLKNVLCTYCDEEIGQVWINNPNPPDFSEEKCWWVCKSCEEVIEIQQELVFASMGDNPKRAEELNNRLLKISQRTGRQIINVQFDKGKEGYKASSIEFTGEKEE